jgi:thiamine pyrophosphokinase
MKKEKIILVLNGETPKKNELIPFLKKYDRILCADGAANKIISINVKPDIILGDFDSFNFKIFDNKSIEIIKLKDQNYNDFQKILNWLKIKNINTIDIIGFDGKRIDHTIGNFSIILNELSNFNLTIFTDSGIFYTIKKQNEFENIHNRYISIFSPIKVNKITSSGLKYDLKNKTLKDIHSGTLNFANQKNVKIITEYKILVFISNEIKIN